MRGRTAQIVRKEVGEPRETDAEVFRGYGGGGGRAVLPQLLCGSSSAYSLGHELANGPREHIREAHCKSA